jgi:Protein of unknown function (DUF3738)
LRVFRSVFDGGVWDDVMTVAKLLFLLLVTQLVSAQTPAPAFEVATIKPAAPNFDGHVHINYPPGDRFSATNITLRALMQWAYAMPETQILGGPPWLSSTRFDIQAKADNGEQMKSLSSEESNELKRRMVQALARSYNPVSPTARVSGLAAPTSMARGLRRPSSLRSFPRSPVALSSIKLG